MSKATTIRFRDEGSSYMVCFAGRDWGSVEQKGGVLWGKPVWCIVRDRKGRRSDSKGFKTRKAAAEALIEQQLEGGRS